MGMLFSRVMLCSSEVVSLLGSPRRARADHFLTNRKFPAGHLALRNRPWWAKTGYGPAAKSIPIPDSRNVRPQIIEIVREHVLLVFGRLFSLMRRAARGDQQMTALWQCAYFPGRSVKY